MKLQTDTSPGLEAEIEKLEAEIKKQNFDEDFVSSMGDIFEQLELLD